MSVRAKFVLAVALAVSLISLLMGSLLGYLYARSLEEQFLIGSMNNANVVADLIASTLNADLTHRPPDGSSVFEDVLEASRLRELMGSIVRGEITYIQVVIQGRVRAHSGDETFLPPEALPAPYSARLGLEKRYLPNGAPYADTARVLDLRFSPDPNPRARSYLDRDASYVRLLFSMAQLEGQIYRQLFQIGLICLFLIGLMTAGGYLISGRWLKVDRSGMRFPEVFPKSSPAPAAQTLSASALTYASAEPGTPPQTPGERELLRFGEIEIDDKSKQVRRANQIVMVSPREFALLKLLASEPGRVFSTQEILESAWNSDQPLTAEDVKKYIYQLRQKLEANPQDPRLIVTVRGFGYTISAL
jgi:hypothetical protein